MKYLLLIATLAIFSSSAMAQQSWWNSVLSAVGLADEQPEAVKTPNIDGLLNSVTSNLGVTSEQAKGGIAALFNFAKQNISAEQFSALTAKIPGIDSVMQYLPVVEEMTKGGLGGLMDQAASYNESLSNLNQLNKQFESLGLNTGMIKDYAQQAKNYLDGANGQEAKQLLVDGLMKI